MKWDYKNPVPCPHCGKSISLETSFTRWVRKNGHKWVERSGNSFSILDIDYLIWNFVDGWFMFIEEKTRGKKMGGKKQKDAFNVIDQLCEHSAGLTYMWKTFLGLRHIEYKGFFYITFSHTDPEDSEWITINDKPATTEDIINLFATGELT